MHAPTETAISRSYSATLWNVVSLEAKLQNQRKKVRPGILAALQLQREALKRKQRLLEREEQDLT